MGFLKGSVSFTRYMAEGDLPKDHRQVYPGQIAKWSFCELDNTTQDERSLGWVNVYNSLDNKLAGQEYFLDHYIILTRRLDNRTVPAKA